MDAVIIYIICYKNDQCQGRRAHSVPASCPVSAIDLTQVTAEHGRGSCTCFILCCSDEGETSGYSIDAPSPVTS